MEYFPIDHDARSRIEKYANLVADGLKERQDLSSGCWFQLIYDGSKKEAPVDKIITRIIWYSIIHLCIFIKGIRLGVLELRITYQTAAKAYKGFIKKFIEEESNDKIKIIQSSIAGLSKSRKGDADYYFVWSKM